MNHGENFRGVLNRPNDKATLEYFTNLDFPEIKGSHLPSNTLPFRLRSYSSGCLYFWFYGPRFLVPEKFTSTIGLWERAVFCYASRNERGMNVKLE